MTDYVLIVYNIANALHGRRYRDCKIYLCNFLRSPFGKLFSATCNSTNGAPYPQDALAYIFLIPAPGPASVMLPSN
jgi:hypothetical protein